MQVYEIAMAFPLERTHRMKNGPRMRTVIVGVAGFEPTTSCSQSRRDTGLRYTPIITI